MSIFRGITANSMIAGRHGDLVHLETTPEVADKQGIMIDLTSIVDGAAIVISLADGRELAGWLIEHCVDPDGPWGHSDECRMVPGDCIPSCPRAIALRT